MTFRRYVVRGDSGSRWIESPPRWTLRGARKTLRQFESVFYTMGFDFYIWDLVEGKKVR